MTISAVLFDFGGVITDDPFRTMDDTATLFSMDPAEFSSIAMGREAYHLGTHPWHQLERGEIEIDDYNAAVDELARSRGHDGFPPLPVDLITEHAFRVRNEMVELLLDLRGSGVRTGILTNNVRALKHWRDLADWDTLVDVVVDSWEVGMRKPEERIYLHACQQLGVEPTAAVFLDDMKPNVEAASAVGLTGIHVTDPAVAIAEVRRLLG